MTSSWTIRHRRLSARITPGLYYATHVRTRERAAVEVVQAIGGRMYVWKIGVWVGVPVSEWCDFCGR